MKGYINKNGHLILEDCRVLDVEYDYNNAIKMLKRYVKEKEF